MTYKTIAFAALTMTFAARAAAQVVIDDFSSGPYNITVNSGTPVAEAVRNGVMLGGQRDALLTFTGGPQDVMAVVDSGAVQFFNADSQTSGDLILQYDGLDGELEDGVLNNGLGLGANLSAASAFVYNLRFVNTGINPTITILTTVTTGAGSFSDSITVASGANMALSHNFADFGGANFADVRRLDFEFIGGPAADFTLDSISTNAIPAPAAALAFLVPLVGRRRRRN